MPLSENGKSSCWTIVPQTPFCPCLLLNLSPSYATNTEREINQLLQIKNTTTIIKTRDYLRPTSVTDHKFDTHVAILIRAKNYPINYFTSKTFKCLWNGSICTGNKENIQEKHEKKYI